MQSWFGPVRSRRGFAPQLVMAASLLLLSFSAPADYPSGKRVLIINQVGLSRRIYAAITEEIQSRLTGNQDYQIEFCSDSLDSMSFPDEISQRDIQTRLAHRYRNLKLDAVMAAGAEPIKFLSGSSASLFPGIPIVFCGSIGELVDQSEFDARFTGSRVELEPEVAIKPTLWERTTWTLLTGLLVILILASLTGYLLIKLKQLRLAREEQSRLSGMLLNAQEAERSRLASELHDDFSQRLAILALDLETAAEMIPESPQEASRQLHRLLNSASEIGADLHTLSRRLHPSTLESLGLVPGVSALCREFAAQQHIQVDFSHENIPSPVPPDVSLCLFRIVQEGLRNLKKHSGASDSRVGLDLVDGSLHVSVCDQGVGFDLKELPNKYGLGIRSMGERARLLGGRFEIHSEPQKGTRIDAWVPFRPQAGMENS
jgi:signal transduction histidine kinase